MLEFFSENFSECIYIAIFLVAMIPTIESKIAIPFAMSVQIWGDATLSPLMAGVIALLGCMVPSIFVIWFSRKLKNKTSGFVFDNVISKVQNRYADKFDKLGSKNSVFKKCMMLATFVAVPLPLTGVYTGSLIAGFTNLKYLHCFVSVLFGEIVSCIVVVLLCSIFENSAFYIFLFSLIILGVYFLVDLSLLIAKRTKQKKEKR